MKDVINNNECIYDFEGREIKITKTIPLFDAMIIINTVKEMSFDEDGGYQPEYTDYALRVETIKAYTDFELPETLEERYHFVYTSELYDDIITLINPAQYVDVESAIKRKIAYQLRTNENQYQKGIEKLMSGFEELETTMGNLLNGVSPEHVTAILSAITNNSVSEEKLVKAYIAETKDK